MLTKFLICGLLVALATGSITTYLYLSTRDELIELETKHMQLKQDLEDCSESKSKIKVSAEQDDRIIAQTQERIKSLVSEKDSLLDKLRNLPRKNCPRTYIENSHEIEYVDIDAPFSDEFLKLFEQSSSNTTEGSSNTPTRQSTDAPLHLH